MVIGIIGGLGTMAVIAAGKAMIKMQQEQRKKKKEQQQALEDRMAGKLSPAESAMQRASAMSQTFIGNSFDGGLGEPPPQQGDMQGQFPQGPQPYQQMPGQMDMSNPFGPQQQQPSTFTTSPDDWMF